MLRPRLPQTCWLPRGPAERFCRLPAPGRCCQSALLRGSPTGENAMAGGEAVPNSSFPRYEHPVPPFPSGDVAEARPGPAEGTRGTSSGAGPGPGPGRAHGEPGAGVA